MFCVVKCFLPRCVQFGLNESHVGVVQYSGAKAQEVVKLGDPNIWNITALKEYVDHKYFMEILITFGLNMCLPVLYVCIVFLLCLISPPPFFFRAIKQLRWLAEATYTGEALEFSWNNLINWLDANHTNSIVLVLTDGRSDTKRDKVPLNVLCGRGLQVRKNMQFIKLKGLLLPLT